MKSIQKIILPLCLILIIILSISWLALRFAAPNPAHRWYSSDYVNLSLKPKDYGIQAEQILSYDLNLPRNDSAEGERVCFCNSSNTAPRGRCNMCLITSAEISTWSIPDFITDDVIIDSKAVASFSADPQIETFLLAAEFTGRELWIFVRQDTYVSDATLSRIQATGGDIIPYFVIDRYDSLLILEQTIPNIIVILLAIGAGVLIVGYIVNNLPKRPSHKSDDLDDAEQSVEDTEEFMKRMERLSKRSKDDDDKKGKA